jgi:hypothetical protein
VAKHSYWSYVIGLLCMTTQEPDIAAHKFIHRLCNTPNYAHATMAPYPKICLLPWKRFIPPATKTAPACPTRAFMKHPTPCGDFTQSITFSSTRILSRAQTEGCARSSSMMLKASSIPPWATCGLLVPLDVE